MRAVAPPSREPAASAYPHPRRCVQTQPHAMAQRDDALAAAATWSDGDDDEPVRKRQAVAVVKATPNSGNTASLLSEPSWSDDAVSGEAASF